MIVHSYARFSSAQQEGNDSLRRQHEAAEAFCARRGWTLSDLRFTDKAKSGFRGNKQKALAAFLAAIEDGRVKQGETLLVEAVDRLSRKGVRATQNLVNRILDSGVDIAILAPVEKVYSAKDSNDIGGAIELAAFAYQASVYSENLSIRIKSYNTNAKKRVANGEKLLISNVTPFWLDWNKDKQKFETIPEAVKAIKLVFKRTIEGVGRPTMLRELNDKYPVAHLIGRKNSKHWNEQQVARIVTLRRVCGDFETLEGEVFKDYYPRIIDEQTWKKANVAAASRQTEKGPNTKRVNMFNGLLYHPVDDCAFGIYGYGPRDKRHRRYKSYKADQGVKGASTATVDCERFEDLVFQFLPTLDLSSKKNAKQDALETERDYLRQEIATLQEQIKTRSKSASVLGPVLTDLASQLEEVEKQLDAAPKRAVQPTKSYRQKLSKMRRGTYEERKLVRDKLRQIVKRIELLPIKLGPLRRDPVKCLVQIQFHTGDYVEALEIPGGELIKLTGTLRESLTDQWKAGWRFDADDYNAVLEAME